MRKLFVALLLFGLLLVACEYPSNSSAPDQKTDQGFWVSGKRDAHVYTVVIQMEDMNSYSEIRGSVSGGGFVSGGFGYGSISGSVWQEGKGLIRARLISSQPEIDFSEVGDIIVVKTTDRKATMGIPGDRLTLYCTVDFEPVCARDGEGNSYCRDLWEFDFCRLVEIEH